MFIKYVISLILFYTSIFADENNYFDIQRYSYIGDLQKVKESYSESLNSSVLKNALLDAGYKNRVDVLKFLLDKGADIDALSSSGRNILNYAVQNENIELVKYLLAKGAKFHTPIDGIDALFSAVRDGNLELIKLLLPYFKELERSYYIETDAFNIKFRTTLLHTAIQNDHLDVAKLLILHGADLNAINRAGETPAICAMRNEYDDFAKYLLDMGAESSVVDIAGNSVLSYALKGGEEAIALKVLENKKFDVMKKLDYKVFAKESYMYEYYINESEKKYQKFNYLHMAARYGMVKVIDKLIERGLKLEEFSDDYFAMDALAYAAWFSDLKTVKHLIELGANPYKKYINTKSEGNYGLAYYAGSSESYTPLSLSLISQSRDEKLIEYLLTLKDAKKFIELESRYFYFDLLTHTEQKKSSSIFNRVLKFCDDNDFKNRDGIRGFYKLLKRKNKSSNQSEKKKESAFVTAIGSGDLTTVTSLIKSNKNIFIENPYAPFYAILHNQYHLLAPLLELGADVNILWNNESLALYAVKWIDDTTILYPVLEEILKHKGSINIASNGITPLLTYLKDKEIDKEFVKKFINLGAKLGNSENTLLKIYTIYDNNKLHYITTTKLFTKEIDKLHKSSNLTDVAIAIYENRHLSNLRIETLFEVIYLDKLSFDFERFKKSVNHDDKYMQRLIRLYEGS